MYLVIFCNQILWLIINFKLCNNNYKNLKKFIVIQIEFLKLKSIYLKVVAQSWLGSQNSKNN